MDGCADHVLKDALTEVEAWGGDDREPIRWAAGCDVMIPGVLPTLVTGYGSVNLREGVPQFMLGLGVSHLPVKSALDIGMGDPLEAFRQ